MTRNIFIDNLKDSSPSSGTLRQLDIAKKALQMHEAGKTFAQIGRELNYSIARVSSLAKMYKEYLTNGPNQNKTKNLTLVNDLGCMSYLTYKGYAHNELTYSSNAKMGLLYEATEAFTHDYETYWEGKALVEPKAFVDAMKRVKNLIYMSKNQNTLSSVSRFLS